MKAFRICLPLPLFLLLSNCNVPPVDAAGEVTVTLNWRPVNVSMPKYDTVRVAGTATWAMTPNGGGPYTSGTTTPSVPSTTKSPSMTVDESVTTLTNLRPGTWTLTFGATATVAGAPNPPNDPVAGGVCTVVLTVGAKIDVRYPLPDLGPGLPVFPKCTCTPRGC